MILKTYWKINFLFLIIYKDLCSILLCHNSKNGLFLKKQKLITEKNFFQLKLLKLFYVQDSCKIIMYYKFVTILTY